VSQGIPLHVVDAGTIHSSATLLLPKPYSNHRSVGVQPCARSFRNRCVNHEYHKSEVFGTNEKFSWVLAGVTVDGVDA
jgi:hypothetical protein